MRYKIKGREIRTENTAKPVSDASTYLVKWLCNREHTRSALDFGCGKLRYTHHLAQQSKYLGIVDSEIQISRCQIIDGVYTSVHRYAKKKWPQCKVHVLEKFCMNPSNCYDFILCANVLSAIPCPKARAKSLRAIYNTLSVNGQVLFVNQHSNSYFKEVSIKPNASHYLDGWIIQSRGNLFYYGVLNKDSVISLITRYDFWVKNAWVEGQSNYILASKGEK